MLKRSDFPIKISDMPEEHELITTELLFFLSDEEKKCLMDGHLSKDMDDKWNVYSEDNIIYFCRSWTGICMYKVRFLDENRIEITANRDPKQSLSTKLLPMENMSMREEFDKYMARALLWGYSR